MAFGRIVSYHVYHSLFSNVKNLMASELLKTILLMQTNVRE